VRRAILRYSAVTNAVTLKMRAGRWSARSPKKTPPVPSGWGRYCTICARSAPRCGCTALSLTRTLGLPGTALLVSADLPQWVQTAELNDPCINLTGVLESLQAQHLKAVNHTSPVPVSALVHVSPRCIRLVQEQLPVVALRLDRQHSDATEQHRAAQTKREEEWRARDEKNRPRATSNAKLSMLETLLDQCRSGRANSSSGHNDTKASRSPPRRDREQASDRVREEWRAVEQAEGRDAKYSHRGAERGREQGRDNSRDRWQGQPREPDRGRDRDRDTDRDRGQGQRWEGWERSGKNDRTDRRDERWAPREDHYGGGRQEYPPQGPSDSRRDRRSRSRDRHRSRSRSPYRDRARDSRPPLPSQPRPPPTPPPIPPPPPAYRPRSPPAEYDPYRGAERPSASSGQKRARSPPQRREEGEVATSGSNSSRTEKKKRNRGKRLRGQSGAPVAPILEEGEEPSDGSSGAESGGETETAIQQRMVGGTGNRPAPPAPRLPYTDRATPQTAEAISICSTNPSVLDLTAPTPGPLVVSIADTSSSEAVLVESMPLPTSATAAKGASSGAGPLSAGIAMDVSPLPEYSTHAPPALFYTTQEEGRVDTTSSAAGSNIHSTPAESWLGSTPHFTSGVAEANVHASAPIAAAAEQSVGAGISVSVAKVETMLDHEPEHPAQGAANDGSGGPADATVDPMSCATEAAVTRTLPSTTAVAIPSEAPTAAPTTPPHKVAHIGHSTTPLAALSSPRSANKRSPTALASFSHREPAANSDRANHSPLLQKMAQYSAALSEITQQQRDAEQLKRRAERFGAAQAIVPGSDGPRSRSNSDVRSDKIGDVHGNDELRRDVRSAGPEDSRKRARDATSDPVVIPSSSSQVGAQGERQATASSTSRDSGDSKTSGRAVTAKSSNSANSTSNRFNDDKDRRSPRSRSSTDSSAPVPQRGGTQIVTSSSQPHPPRPQLAQPAGTSNHSSAEGNSSKASSPRPGVPHKLRDRLGIAEPTAAAANADPTASEGPSPRPQRAKSGGELVLQNLLGRGLIPGRRN
jgi:hypothetical protein